MVRAAGLFVIITKTTLKMKISEEQDWGGINDGFLTPAPPPLSYIRPSFAYYIFVLEQAAEQYIYSRKDRLAMLHEVDRLKIEKQNRQK